MGNKTANLSQEHWFENKQNLLTKKYFLDELCFYIEQVEKDEIPLMTKNHPSHSLVQSIRNYNSDAVITYAFSSHSLEVIEVMVNYIADVNSLLPRLLKSEEMIGYHLNDNTRLFRGVAYDFLKFLKSIIKYESINYDAVCSEIKSYKRIYEFNPYIDLFFSAFNALSSKTSNFYGYGINEDCFDPNLSEKFNNINQQNVHNEFIDEVNGFINELRIKALSLEFKNAVYQYRFASQKNVRSLWRYIERLLKQYPKLLVSRIDLSYQIENSRKPTAFYMKTRDEVFSAYQQAKKDRQRLFNNMRTNHLFDAVVGYCWRLECAAQKGFHYQCLFFLDGTTVIEDEVFAQYLGEYWRYVITKGKGRYYHCRARYNRLKDFKYAAIGMVERDNPITRDCLKRFIEGYLVTSDAYAKVLTGDEQGRTFGKGGISQPKPKKPKTRGRPRKLVDDF